ncbi:MAG: hypothetical protein CMG07_02070 [Candidatus Marinimicrobia bacterium]|nr:hypothetical protein [Candidatus Neomarinimicrobiota bacterium]
MKRLTFNVSLFLFKIYISFFIIDLSFSASIDESIIEKFLQDDDNVKWNLVNKIDNQTIYNKKIKDSKIPVVKVVVIDSVTIDGMVQAIINVKDHTRFLKSSYLTKSMLLNKNNNENIFKYEVYQYLNIPFIKNRFYIAYCNLELNIDRVKVNWRLSDDNKKHLDIINDNKNDIFIENGFGYWKIEYLSENFSKITYLIHMNPGGWVPNFIINLSSNYTIPETVVKMINEGKRLDKLD